MFGRTPLQQEANPVTGDWPREADGQVKRGLSLAPPPDSPEDSLQRLQPQRHLAMRS